MRIKEQETHLTLQEHGDDDDDDDDEDETWDEQYIYIYIQGWAMKRKNYKTLQKSTHEFFICLLALNEKLMNSHFVLCQFENLF